MYGFFVLRRRDVQHPTSTVYHVLREAVLTALSETAVEREVELGKVPGPLSVGSLSELLFLFLRQETHAIIILAPMGGGTCRI